ncbi:MAG TPA: hypothetical protein VNI01_12440 [Elusimicrobiota bacterium]|jgi:hypothetical protein|nr:hypothetical protein [Elusimicrobiota bacterium]
MMATVYTLTGAGHAAQGTDPMGQFLCAIGGLHTLDAVRASLTNPPDHIDPEVMAQHAAIATAIESFLADAIGLGYLTLGVPNGFMGG